MAKKVVLRRFCGAKSRTIFFTATAEIEHSFEILIDSDP
jgi:hypothetical protein